MNKNALYFSLFILHFLFTSSVNAVCNASAPATTPTTDFTVHNDGTVTHNRTGLMWKVCSEGQTWNNTSGGSCTGTATTHNWQESLEIPNTLNTGGGFAGHSDWRLPNLKELKSIAELSCYNPAINEAIFNSALSNGYWSSSPFSSNSDRAWRVHFNYGYDYDNYRSSYNRVRLVRSGQ